MRGYSNVQLGLGLFNLGGIQFGNLLVHGSSVQRLQVLAGILERLVHDAVEEVTKVAPEVRTDDRQARVELVVPLHEDQVVVLEPSVENVSRELPLPMGE